MNAFTTYFVNSCFGKTTAPEIIAVLRNGKEIKFTAAILQELIHDNEVKTIYNATTGEVIHYKED